MRIGYVLKRYPRLSETFIVQEILQMERRGADLVLFPIMDSHEPLQNPLVNEVRAPVVYVQRSLRRAALGMLADHVHLCVASPSGYRRALGHLLRSSLSLASFRAFLQAGRLVRLAQEHKVDHLHAHFAHSPASLARYASLFTGIPYSFTAHAKDLYLSQPNSLVNKAELATFITTCTAFNAAYLAEVVGSENAAKIRVVYHGVDTDRFHPPAQRVVNSAPVIVSVGRLVPKKGLRHLVDAAALLRQRGKDFCLDIYGDGPLLSILRTQIAAAGLSNIVRLRGACTQQELAEVYRRADVFALAPVVMEDGDRDGIPNVLLEAMASGLPAVSTAISGIPEVIADQKNGVLVSPGDASALADGLQMLLEEPALRSRLGRAACNTVVRDFDAARTSERMAELLQLESCYENRLSTG